MAATPASAPTLWLHATNVHTGGGRALLQPLLSALPTDRRVIANLDQRMPLAASLPASVEVRRVAPTMLDRLAAEWRLAREVQPGDRVLCFGNLPPLRRLRGQVSVFIQNRYLIDSVSLDGFPLKTRLRLALERRWLRSRIANADELVVQTSSMQALAEALAGTVGKPVRVLPFASREGRYERSLNRLGGSGEFDFIYVASGEPHKNHRRLVEAWVTLASDGHRPSLWLTLDRTAFAGLCDWIDERTQAAGLRIENLGWRTHGEVMELYPRARALIYPSLFESFGLPLIEARLAGVAVLASELDYVRDILDPEEAFDPLSAASIARAVKRFEGWAEPALPLLNAEEFLRSMYEEQERPCAS